LAQLWFAPGEGRARARKNEARMLHSAIVEYRFFVPNTAERVQSSSFALCEDDVEAVEHAANPAQGAAIEVWDVGRLVFRLGRRRQQGRALVIRST
jgi:hypothetical protein